MKIFSFAALAALLWFPAPAAAQTGESARSANCSDDNGVDRCAAAQQAKTRAVFAAAPVEKLAAEGTQLIRAFFVNGYGRDEALIAFIRPSGGDPEAVVTFPSADSSGRKALRAPVPAAIWDRLFVRARYFDRDLVPLPADKDQISMCLHSWVVTVEAATPAGTQGGIRRKTQDACGDGMAVPLAFEMADIAVELFPACALLNAEQHRNAVTRLGACALLEGDRIAAALAMNQYESNWFANPNPGMGMSIAYLFYDQAEIDWPGEPVVRGSTAAASAWVERMQKRHFWMSRVVGETPDRVRIEGMLQDMSSDEPGGTRRAKAVQIWTRENGFGFRLRSLKVEAFEPSR